MYEIFALSFSVVCPKMEVPTNRSSDGYDSSLFQEVWNLEYTVPIFLVFLISPLLNFKSATFFTKFNSFGNCYSYYVLCSISSVIYILGDIYKCSFPWCLN